MMLPAEVATSCRRRLALACAAGTLVAITLIPGAAAALPTVALKSPVSLGLPLLWFAGAAGLGAWLARRRIGPANEPIISLALGTALLLTIVQFAARTGLLTMGSGLAAWGLLIACMLPLIPELSRSTAHRSLPSNANLRTLAAAAAIACGTTAMLVAAHAEPGWLWRSEFGGYDVLSYHLQLPAEWMADGRAGGLTHNVYAFLPSFMETAYLHLFLLRGNAPDAAISAQVLHAGMMLLAAACLHRAIVRAGRPEFGPTAAALLLAIPWITVTGSMAYNEGVLVMALAAGLTIVLTSSSTNAGRRTWIPLGLLVGAACGAKPTAAFMVGLPLAAAILLLRPMPLRTLLRATTIGGLCAFLPLLPWLIHNALVCGNPIFPYGSSLFGHAHWSADQLTRWHEAHRSAPEPMRVVTRFIIQGIGPTREAASEPWLPQWSLLPILGIAGTIVALCKRVNRDEQRLAVAVVVMLFVQIFAWLMLTHQQSRFLLPTAPLLALGAIMLIPRTRAGLGLVAAALPVALSLPPALLLRGEGGGTPLATVGARDLLTGRLVEELLQREIDPEKRRTLIMQGSAAYWLNHMLPEEARVLAVGWATPFFIRTGRLTYETVWDRGPWDAAVMRAGAENPGGVMEVLAEMGYTHLLVDHTMLAIWDASGWSAPTSRPEIVRAIIDTHAPLLVSDERHLSLHQIPTRASTNRP